LKKHSNQLLDLIEFGEEPILRIDSEYLLSAIKFVCLLYDEHFKSEDINSLRYKLFTKKGISGEKLSPTVDSLLQHLRRCNYQTYIWNNATSPILELSSPCGNGWKMDEKDLELTHKYMLKQAVPETMKVMFKQ